MSDFWAKVALWAAGIAAFIGAVTAIFKSGESKGKNKVRADINEKSLESVIEDEKAEQNIKQADPDTVRAVGRRFMRKSADNE